MHVASVAGMMTCVVGWPFAVAGFDLLHVCAVLLLQALKEMNGKYIGNRPCKLSKSTWKERAAPVGRGGGGGNKRKDNPAAAAGGGSGDGAAKVQKVGPRAKYHVPIMRQK